MYNENKFVLEVRSYNGYHCCCYSSWLNYKVFDDCTEALSHIPTAPLPEKGGDGGPIGWNVYEVPPTIDLSKPEQVEYDDFVLVGSAITEWESGGYKPNRKYVFTYCVGDVSFRIVGEIRC